MCKCLQCCKEERKNDKMRGSLTFCHYERTILNLEEDKIILEERIKELEEEISSQNLGRKLSG